MLVLAMTAAYLGVAALGMGGLSDFMAHPSLVAMAVITFALAVASLFTAGNLSAGVKEDKGNRWVFWVFALVGALSAYLPAWAGRHGIWIIGDGMDCVRWAGTTLVLVGGVVRLWPVFVLGRRFSGLVAIQPGHTLVTDGIYAVIRHPSYLGLLIYSFGWGIAFRSWVGVLLAALMIPPLLGRIVAEERLLAGQFGAQYEAYRARTRRLIPWLY